MSTRIPLVVGDDGHPQQLQPNDQILASMAIADTRMLKNAEPTVTCPICTPVIITAGGFLRGQANARATSGVIGLVYDAAGIAPAAKGNLVNSGVHVATLAQWDAVVTGESNGLTPGADYFLDATSPGKLTTTPPAASGLVNTFIGQALSTTELELTIRKPIAL